MALIHEPDTSVLAAAPPLRKCQTACHLAVDGVAKFTLLLGLPRQFGFLAQEPELTTGLRLKAGPPGEGAGESLRASLSGTRATDLVAGAPLRVQRILIGDHLCPVLLEKHLAFDGGYATGERLPMSRVHSSRPSGCSDHRREAALLPGNGTRRQADLGQERIEDHP